MDNINIVEETLWGAVQDHIARGGFIKDGHWGIKFDPDENCIVPENPSFDCRCLFSSLCGTRMPVDAATCKLGISGALIHNLFQDLNFTVNEISSTILGFDRQIGTQMFAGYDKQAYDLGQRLRAKCQKLPQWRGSKG